MSLPLGCTVDSVSLTIGLEGYLNLKCHLPSVPRLPFTISTEMTLYRGRYWNFIESVVREILTKLKIKDKHVTKHLIGMDERVEAVVKLLDVDSGGVRFVLLHGMGGIGKTTLAKVVFNKLNSLFSHCCFLENVQESSSSFGFVALQKQILSNMFGSGFHNGIDDGDGVKLMHSDFPTGKSSWCSTT